MEMLGVPSRPWSEANRALAQALTLHDKALCPGGCGYYLDETSGQDGCHESKTIICGACATRDQDDKERTERVPGELRYIVPA